MSSRISQISRRTLSTIAHVAILRLRSSNSLSDQFQADAGRFWRRGSDLAQVMPSYPIAGQQQPTQITSAINYQTPQASANFFQPQLQHTVSHSTYQSVPHQHHFTQQAMSQQPVERDKMLQQPLSHPEMSHYSMDHVLQHVNPPGRTVEQLQQHRPRSQSPVAYPTPSHYNGSNGFTPSIAQQLKNVSHYATTPTADVSRPFSSMSSTLGSELHSPQIAGTSPPPSKW